METQAQQTDAIIVYWRTRSASALANVVAPELQFVYSLARRQVADEVVAEDVTTAVFQLLAHKPPNIRQDALAEWLTQTTRICAAAARQVTFVSPGLTAGRIPNAYLAMLDVSLTRLKSRHRQAICLRFFRGMGAVQIGRQMHIGEIPARELLAAAIDKLRHDYKRHGLKLSPAAAVEMLSAAAFVPPMIFAERVLNGSAARGRMVQQILEGALRIRNKQRAKITAAIVMAMMMIGLAMVGLARMASPMIAPLTKPTTRQAPLPGIPVPRATKSESTGPQLSSGANSTAPKIHATTTGS